MKRTIALLVSLAALTAALPASGASRGSQTWATLNICDPPGKNADTLGIRAQAAGNGLNQQIFMRFRAQYYDTDVGRWRPVPGKGTSRFFRAGSARFRTQQRGYSVKFNPTVQPSSFRLRGKVDYEYREERRDGRTRVARRFTRATTGRRRPAGADPNGYSRGECTVKLDAAPQPQPQPTPQPQPQPQPSPIAMVPVP